MTNEQIDLLKPGDVIRSPSGRFRTIYAVSKCKGRISVTVPILHCSWTHRGCTNLDRFILKSYRATKLRRPIRRTKLQKKVYLEANKCTAERHCSCCDVIGILE